MNPDPLCPVCSRFVMTGQRSGYWKGHRTHAQCAQAKLDNEKLIMLSDHMEERPLTLVEARALWFELEEM